MYSDSDGSSSKDEESSSSSDEESYTYQRLLKARREDDMLSSARVTKRLTDTFTTYMPAIVAMSMLKRPHGGSVPRRRQIPRDTMPRHEVIVRDYFSGGNSKYPSEHFRRRFRMHTHLFNRILCGIARYDDFFTPKPDATNKFVSPLQKMGAAVRMLAYGCCDDFLDEYFQMGESTIILSLKKFCEAVIGVFEEQYLRKPNEDDIARLLEEGEERGFPGMLGSLDCMHWHWKNCPTAWHGTHTNGFKRVPTLILEVVASKNLWIWHAFFGMAGTNNDITVLDRSPLFNDLVNEVAPPCQYTVNGNIYDMGYYLSDGIYPPYATLMQTISDGTTRKERFFAKRQEAVRKDVERAFGVLQSRWHIIKGPARMWRVKDLGNIMKTCIILHNMIIENEQEQGIDPERYEPYQKVDNVTVEHDSSLLVAKIISRLRQIRDKEVHNQLKLDLIDHMWDFCGGEEV
ncbi:protein ALP1-like [Papaver somniferum]|uniref:protein ALP1-like n=1 Tax=Papaver somniferum TaxID=3469 RepID=UPI000E705B9E|nr:protein ALP1-like [Papaver somniferum]